jgi:aminoglycoside phosphotransferase (APT) family kinase protein
MNSNREQSVLDDVIASLVPLLGAPESDVVPLVGGITNRNFRVAFRGRDYVVRVVGKNSDLLGIDRRAERLAVDKAAELGIGPPAVAMLSDPPCLVTAFLPGGVHGAADLREPGTLAEVAVALRRFHDSGLELPTRFDVFELVGRYADLVRTHGAELPDGFDAWLACSREISNAIAGTSGAGAVPCHNDLLSANFLKDESGLKIIDWEYAGMGNRYFDLGNFAVNNAMDEADERAFLEAYFGEPADDDRYATLRLFRFMSDFREAMWGAVQTAVSELDFPFDDYAQMHFARLATTMADARLSGWLQAARS